MIEVIPAIDIIGGRCVRLSQGDYDRTTVYDAKPYDAALRFRDSGASRIHLVDLDGAKASSPCNLDVLEAIASIEGLDVEWGGGIKTSETLSSVLSAGATYAVIGSVAALQPELFIEWLSEYGPDRIIFGADIKDGRLAVKGWLEDSRMRLPVLLERFSGSGLRQVICTDISRDGMLGGPNALLYTSLATAFPGMEFTVSGGIGSFGDIIRMQALGLPRVIVGKAYYEGKITLEDLERWWRSE